MKEMNTEVVVVNGSKNIIRYPKKPDRMLLEVLYDTCNELFKDNPKCFYSHEEVEEMRKDGTKIFI